MDHNSYYTILRCTTYRTLLGSHLLAPCGGRETEKEGSVGEWERVAQERENHGKEVLHNNRFNLNK